jgi:hypothetical protein
MNEEFAIEPTAFNDFKDVRFVLGKFGFHEGRFISALPSKWVNEVYAQLEKLPDGPSKLRAKELVRKIAKEYGGIGNSGVSFDPSKLWLTNAVTCGNEFAGIIVSGETASGRQGDGYKTIDEIDDSFFGSCREVKLLSTVEQFGRVATKLLDFSYEVFLIDPYFNFSKPSNIDVLKEFVRIGAKGKCKEFVIYTAAKVNKFDAVEKILRQYFLGSGASIKVYHVEQDVSEYDYHARYLLSQFGGIRFDKGFQAEDVLRDVAAIDIGMHSELRKMYLDGEHGFKILAEHNFQG